MVIIIDHFLQYFSFIGGGTPEKTTDLQQVTDKRPKQE
jgi:hypothetical protein